MVWVWHINLRCFCYVWNRVYSVVYLGASCILWIYWKPQKNCINYELWAQRQNCSSVWFIACWTVSFFFPSIPFLAQFFTHKHSYSLLFCSYFCYFSFWFFYLCLLTIIYSSLCSIAFLWYKRCNRRLTLEFLDICLMCVMQSFLRFVTTFFVNVKREFFLLQLFPIECNAFAFHVLWFYVGIFCWVKNRITTILKFSHASCICQ